MPDIVAKAMAVITGALLVIVVGVLYVSSRPSSNARQVVAEFRDAFPILQGMQVRTNGASSGSVGPIDVTDKGIVKLTLLVDKTIPAPKANATATIKQFDSTGDSYVAYDPGSSGGPLREEDGKPTIACDASSPVGPCTNTLAAPRLDDLVNAFGVPEQAGIKLILQNLSDAVADRGDDINRAALRLVPALDAANKALAEVNGQNQALKSLITSTEAVSGQAASRKTQLAGLISGLEQTLRTTTDASRGLDAGLEALPATEARLRSTLGALARAARAGGPLAADLRASAPGLSTLLDRAPGFLDDLRAALKDAGPTLDLTSRLLVAGAPTIAADPKRVVTGSFDLAPALSNLLTGILGGDETIKAFFGDEKQGAAESRSNYGFGLGAASAEPGDVTGYPSEWKDRNWLRVTGMVSCETFGAAVKPGCLTELLAARGGKSGTATRKKQKAKRPARLPELPKTLLPKRTPGKDAAKPILNDALTDALGAVSGAVDRTRDALDGILKPSRGGNQGSGGNAGDSVKNLLDFLLD